MELDEAYANAAHIAGAADYPPRWAECAKAFRDRRAGAGRAKLALPYGDRPREVFDLFLPSAAPKGLSVFVHGGYWLRFDNSYWSHLATGPLAQGWAVAMPSYDLCPDVRIADITRQIACAISEAAQHIAGPLALTGHSAGGHLVARMGVQGVLPSKVAQRLHSIVPISPVADLRPLLKTSMNAQLGLGMAAAMAESPVLMQPMDVPVSVWVGGDERPAFLDQARWLAEAWGCGYMVAEGKHHFDVIDALADPDSAMVSALLG